MNNFHWFHEADFQGRCSSLSKHRPSGKAPSSTKEKIWSTGQKKRHAILRVSVLALPIFPGRRQPSIVGRNELNYRVRNGNGWTLALISTNCVVAKSALLRFRLRQKLRTLPCSSFSSRIRFAGFRSDQDLRLYVIRSSGEHPVLYCLFRALSRGSLFDLQTSAAFEDREGKAAEGVSFRTSCGSKRSAACFDVVTRTGFEPMLTA